MSTLVKAYKLFSIYWHKKQVNFNVKIHVKTGVNVNGVTIKKGFPPKPIVINAENLLKSLTENGIKNKETLIVEEDPNAPKIVVPKLEE